MREVFIGYPSEPPEIVDNLTAAIKLFRSWGSGTNLIPWTDLDGPSTPVIGDVRRSITGCDGAFFDVTRPNQNVFYEIGYSVGLGKPTFLLLNTGIKDAVKKQVDLGLFDTQRLKHYRNGTDVAHTFRDARQPYQSSPPAFPLDRTQPIFFQHHLAKSEFATSYFACVKQQRLGLRTHDPEEDRRLPLDRAAREVGSSAGIFLSLLPPTVVGDEDHNLRAFLLAGLADGFGIPRCLIKYGEFVTAFDLRDGVTIGRDRPEIVSAVSELVPAIHERMQSQEAAGKPLSRSHLLDLSLGATSAENEIAGLDSYFLETREFRRTLRGEARLVIGRKGAGKTAIFWQVRNRVRANRGNLVLDLRPEGYQLRKLSEVIAENFSEATHAHTMSVFWEYVLYLELAHKILEHDKNFNTRDRHLEEPYAKLREAYENVDEFREGDFPERLLRLVGRLRAEVRALTGEAPERILTTPEITELIYKTDFPMLRGLIFDYLHHKQRTLILVDNLDRGWTTAGVSASDVRIVQCLIDAGRRIERAATKRDVMLSSVIFLRDDVYEWLVRDAADRGKDSVVRVVWSEVSLLRELVELRLRTASADLKIEPALTWSQISQGTVDHEDVFSFLVRHCLRRPRSLLDLIELSLSNAALGGRSAITPEDATHAVQSYSAEMLRDLNYEVRDVFPEADKIIYAFTKEGVRLDYRNVLRIAFRQLKDNDLAERFVRLMQWFGFFGIVGPDGTESYVFDHGDDLDLLRAHGGTVANPILCIHPLFRHALSTHSDMLF